MLMEFAETSAWRRASSGSAKASLTRRWQSSNVPSTAATRTLPPRVENRRRCASLT
jgi:hypothetical protein